MSSGAHWLILWGGSADAPPPPISTDEGKVIAGAIYQDGAVLSAIHTDGTEVGQVYQDGTVSGVVI